MDNKFNYRFSSRDTTTLSVSFAENITIREMCETMLGRISLAVDLTSYTTRDIPIAVMTVMVDGRNAGSTDSTVSIIPYVNL